LLAFAAPADYAVGPNPLGVAGGDFNNDGNLDLVTANAGDNTVSVLLGNANGTFQPAQTSAGDADGAYAGSLTVGDVNADGNLDLAAADYTFGGSDQGISTRLGNGDGTFAPAFRQSTLFSAWGNYNYDFAFADLNADRKLDAVVMLYQEDGFSAVAYAHIGVLIGHGDGTFEPRLAYSVGYNFDTTIVPHSPVLADFNRDGKTDLAVGETTYNNSPGPTVEKVKVFLGNGDGTWQPHRDSVADPYIIGSPTAGDFTSDGIPDLVTNGNGMVSVLPGRGDGTFAAPIVRSAPAASWMADEDFNGDGRLDLVMLDATTDLGGVASLLLGRGDGTFHATEGFAVGPGPTATATGDFNGDGRADFAVTRSDSVTGAGAVSVLLNDGTWSALPASVSIGDAMLAEGNTGSANATFTLTLSRATEVDVTVTYSTANITAAGGGDYTAASGTVTIPAGQTSRTFTVAVNGDRLAEPSETFSVNLIDPTNATIGDGQGVGTIVDDEPRISIGDVSRLEGKNGRTTQFTFTATLSAAYDQPVTTSFRTADGTARLSDRDYIAKAGTITFNPGETSKTITIEVRGDNRQEANEAFYVDLLDASSNALFARSRGMATILNDD
jgi:hypothetical protein